MPMPTSSRPAASQSTVAISLAVATGLRCGSRHTAVPMRTRSVLAAMKPRAAKGSSIPDVAGMVILPSPAYG